MALFQSIVFLRLYRQFIFIHYSARLCNASPPARVTSFCLNVLGIFEDSHAVSVTTYKSLRDSKCPQAFLLLSTMLSKHCHSSWVQCLSLFQYTKSFWCKHNKHSDIMCFYMSCALWKTNNHLRETRDLGVYVCAFLCLCVCAHKRWRRR